ncbi:MAG: hypothetical protein Q8R78_04310, partial [Candidatus Omnitrophota bacterium]|nr:hypothetical protein [Candidatus Omnitrophota bacterium]
LDLVKLLIPLGVAVAVLLLKIGAAKTEIAGLRRDIQAIKAGQDVLMRQDVWNQAQAHVESRVDAIDKRLDHVEKKVFNGT